MSTPAEQDLNPMLEENWIQSGDGYCIDLAVTDERARVMDLLAFNLLNPTWLIPEKILQSLFLEWLSG